ncbi:hypothetical protein ABZT06_22395 [Streptomyces sp. NPDC005483]|uniref:hypothetical protein n=1 Tax=Streptomyces sp. NPDC005483 TaxID=3154882 RepID=UPI0033BB8463
MRRPQHALTSHDVPVGALEAVDLGQGLPDHPLLPGVQRAEVPLDEGGADDPVPSSAAVPTAGT